MMGSIQLKPGDHLVKPVEHLEMVLKNPSTILAKEKALSESTYPLLAAYYQWLRKINSVHNKLDVVIQNEQILSEFIFLCQNNLLFFLTATGRFDIIRSLFTDNKLTGRSRHLVHLIQQEYEKAHNQQSIPPLKSKSSEVKLAESPVMADWKQYANGLTNMDLYSYYQQEIKRVSYEYNIQQTQVLYQAFVARTNILDMALSIIRTDESVHTDIRLEAEELFNRYASKKEALKDYGDINSPGSILDLRTVEQRLLAMQQHYEESKEIHDFLQKYSNVNDQFAELLLEDEEHTETVKKQLKLNKKLFKAQMAELQTHMQIARKGAHDDIEKSLHHIIHFINNCPKDKLKAQEKIVLDEAIQQLQEYKETFKKTESLEDIQALLKECAGELDKVEDILSAVLPTQALKVLVKEISLFKEGIVDLKEPIPDELLITINIPAGQSEESEVLPEVAFMQTSVAQNEESDTNKNPPETEKGEINSTVQVAKDLKIFKLHLQTLREGEEPIELNEEEQNKYKLEINKLAKLLTIVKKSDSINEEDEDLISEVKELVDKIKNGGFEQIHPNHVKSLYDKIVTLESRFEQFNETKLNLSTLLNSLAINVESNAQLQS